MRWRSVAGDTHPLAIPLLGAVSACAFGSLYWLIGVGGTPLHGALTFAILYGCAGSAWSNHFRSLCKVSPGHRGREFAAGSRHASTRASSQGRAAGEGRRSDDRE
jgi:hypothetical protein